MTDDVTHTPRAVPVPVAADDPRLMAVARLLAIVDALRAPGGCPWDREQTEATMAPYLVEEALELVDAIEDGGTDAMASEAGDCLVALLLILRIAEDGGRYDLERAARAACEKLVRRHPHVFGSVVAANSGEALERWEDVKRAEREAAGEDASALAGIPRGLPALQRAGRTCQKAVAAGFHWEDARGALAKVEEELVELLEVLPQDVLREAPKGSAQPKLDDAARAKVEHELGDLLMATAFLGGYLQLDPEALCRAALRRFEGRFRDMEQQLGGSLAGRDLPTMMSAWVRAKENLGDTE